MLDIFKMRPDFYQGAGKRPRTKGTATRGPESGQNMRGRAKLSARLDACQCYYMFFTTQLKITKFIGRSQDLNVG